MNHCWISFLHRYYGQAHDTPLYVWWPMMSFEKWAHVVCIGSWSSGKLWCWLGEDVNVLWLCWCLSGKGVWVMWKYGFILLISIPYRKIFVAGFKNIKVICMYLLIFLLLFQRMRMMWKYVFHIFIFCISSPLQGGLCSWLLVHNCWVLFIIFSSLFIFFFSGEYERLRIYTCIIPAPRNV